MANKTLSNFCFTESQNELIIIRVKTQKQQWGACLYYKTDVLKFVIKILENY